MIKFQVLVKVSSEVHPSIMMKVLALVTGDSWSPPWEECEVWLASSKCCSSCCSKSAFLMPWFQVLFYLLLKVCPMLLKVLCLVPSTSTSPPYAGATYLLKSAMLGYSSKTCVLKSAKSTLWCRGLFQVLCHQHLKLRPAGYNIRFPSMVA